MAKVQFFALGGQDENGKNCYVLEVDKSIYIINSGTKTPIKSTYGIDNIIPDFTYLEKNKNRIKGIFFTDTKNNSFSALPWLLMRIDNVKIYSSAFSKAIILDRISKYKIGHNKFEVIPIVNKTRIDNIDIIPFIIGSSLPFSLGFNFQTSDGDFIFLSNVVLGEVGKQKMFGITNLTAIKSTISKKGLIGLILDSGFSNFNGNTINKINLSPILEETFSKAKENERIIVGCYDEEMATMQQILDLAIKYNRPVVPYGRAYSQLLSLLKIAYSNMQFPKIEDYEKAGNILNAIYLVAATTERLYQRFTRITDNNDVYLKLKNTDHVIMIAPPLNGLESYAAYTLDEIARITRNITDISDNDFYQYRAAKQDVYDIVKMLKPKYFLPIQGLYRYLVVASKEAEKIGYGNDKIIILQNGKIAEFINGTLASRNKKLPNLEEVIIDGFGVGDISKEVIHEREILAREGLVSISTLISDKTKKQVGKININYVGLFSQVEKDEVNEWIDEIVRDEINEVEFFDQNEILNSIRKNVRKKIFKKIFKEPIVVVSFYII
ncbi:ribonuclease J [[Mycoplasma] mobile]|uniref:Predicted hydrolase n=1 Tax=Mycoplasma mobile (strain ATCC 43663 / 163K / NCTC 11711) TaxID=267748 RepID=Q6KH24_MYCM1|nr:ribonuclease J [[Mycoplasma] mobile]AAT28107.1 predicted hydrolase [Mycoplasma mobile 163K]